jgi:hypothetical protein
MLRGELFNCRTRPRSRLFDNLRHRTGNKLCSIL